MPYLILAILSGVAHVMFVGTFLGPQGSFEMSASWCFGFAVALFVAALTRSIQGRGLEHVK